MDRDTKTIEIEAHKFIVKTYATAREANAIQQALFKSTKIEVVGEAPKISDFDPSVLFEMQQEMVRQMVVSMDDREDGIVERCLDLPSEEFDALVRELDKLVSKKKS